MKILVTPSSFGECGPKPIQLLEESGYEIQMNPNKRRLTSDEVVSLGSDCIGIIAGLEKQTSGSILLDSKPIDSPSSDRGMVFQNYTLFPWLTI